MAKNAKGFDVPDGFTADLILITAELDVVMIRRKNDPFKGMLALPGGHVNPGETSYQAALREAKEEIGLDREDIVGDIKLVGVYDTPGRDPRGWYVGHAYKALLRPSAYNSLKASDDASSIEFVPLCKLGIKNVFAFDHQDMVFEAMLR